MSQKLPAYDASWYNAPGWGQESFLASDAASTMSKRWFSIAIGLFILFGFMMAAVGAFTVRNVDFPWIWILGGVLGGFIGLEINLGTPNWKLSFFGLALSYFSMGLVFSPIIQTPGAGWVRSALELVAIGTLLLTIVGAIVPAVVEHWGGFLAASVLAVGIAFWTSEWWLHYVHAPEPSLASIVIAALVMAYMDYFWTRAMGSIRNVDNAIAVAGSLYSDVIQMALELAEKLTEKKKK